MREFNRVFGVGMPKTGTHSLATALNALGVKTSHYDDRIMQHFRRSNYRPARIAELRGLVNTSEHVYPQLDTAWPSSLFVMTERGSVDEWLDSCSLIYTDVPDDAPHFVEVFGTTKFHRERWRYVYELHNRNVREYFEGRTGDLLIVSWWRGDGWRELCEFLQVDEGERGPFPHDGVSPGGYTARRAG